MNVKERILNLAQEKFFRHGFYKVSLDELVAELRTSKSSLYNHFKSKDDLVSQVLQRVNSEINQNLEKILNDRKLSFYGKLSEIFAFTVRLLDQAGDDFLKDLRTYTPDLWKDYMRMRDERINRYYRSLFDSGIKEGIIRNDLDIELILEVYLKLTEISVSADAFSGGKLSNQEVYRQISILFLEGVRKQP
jgi:AcrR family transcriptional regulator